MKGIQRSNPRLLPNHELRFGLWRMDGGFVSSIRIKNSLIVTPLDVTPVLYMADGTAYRLPTAHLPISGVATVNVNAELAAAPSDVMRSLSSFGSASLRYTYGTPGHVLGSVEVLDIPRSLFFAGLVRRQFAGCRSSSKQACADCLNLHFPTSNSVIFPRFLRVSPD